MKNKKDMFVKVPTFTKRGQDYLTLDKINNREWEVRNNRLLAVKDTTIILLFGSEKDSELLNYYKDTHNANLLLGITDKEYNNLLINSD